MKVFIGSMTFSLWVANAGLLVCSTGCSDSDDTWAKGVFKTESKFKDRCENPRSGSDPYSNIPYPDKQGDLVDEKNWLRSWSNRTYLWYDEIIDTNPSEYDSAVAYFDTQKTNQLTSTGAPKDNFHYALDTALYRQQSQTSTSAGYGVEWAVISPTVPRKVLVAFTRANSPAVDANLTRGTEIIEVDGVSVVYDETQIGVDTLNAGLFPDSVGESHTFLVRDIGATQSRSVTMQSKLDKTDPVLQASSIDTPSGKVGYVVFNDFDKLAEEQLVDTFAQLAADNVSDLVLDLRYNRGGLVDIASQLAFMIAGEVQTAGKIFCIPVYNDRHRTIDPFYQQPIMPVPFYNETLDHSLPSGQALPSLNLARVFVLSSDSTCSASELVINSLRGIDIEVILIGGTTCGKPYAYVPTDNCGTMYMTIQIKLSNQTGFGDYASGFSPANSPNTFGVKVTGCSLADDFYSALGDVNEDLLAAALAYRDSANCPPPTGRSITGRLGKSRSKGRSLFDSEIYRRRQLFRQALILSERHSP